MKRVVIASPKGGCGKTTLARNLAATAATEGWSVATADLDMQRTFTRWARRRPANLPGIVHYEATMSEAETLMTDDGIEPADVLLVDTPPSVEAEPAQAKRLMTRADLVLVPCRATFDDVESAVPYLRTLRAMGISVSVVLNAAKPRVNVAAEKTMLMGAAELCPIEIGDRADFNRAASKGLSLVDFTGHVGGDEFRGLWTYVRGRLSMPAMENLHVPA